MGGGYDVGIMVGCQKSQKITKRTCCLSKPVMIFFLVSLTVILRDDMLDNFEVRPDTVESLDTPQAPIEIAIQSTILLVILLVNLKPTVAPTSHPTPIHHSISVKNRSWNFFLDSK